MAKAKAKAKAGKRSKRKTAGKRKTAAKRKTAGKRKSARRTLVAPRGNKRYVRRTSSGQFNEVDDVGRSLSTDRRRKANRKAPRGQGDRGDR
jgi:hypothetical protein